MAKKIRIEDELFDRVKKVADVAGYSSPEEFIMHIIERELLSLEEGGESEEEIKKRLQGLGYIS